MSFFKVCLTQSTAASRNLSTISSRSLLEIGVKSEKKYCGILLRAVSADSQKVYAKRQCRFERYLEEGELFVGALQICCEGVSEVTQGQVFDVAHFRADLFMVDLVLNNVFQK